MYDGDSEEVEEVGVGINDRQDQETTVSSDIFVLSLLYGDLMYKQYT